MPRVLFLVAALTLSAAGCNEAARPEPSKPGESAADEAKIRANLDKLSPEDRAVAEEQKFCAHETNQRLGAMGVPIKVVVKGEPVFVCCKACEKPVEKNPDEALATVKRLREQTGKKG